MISEPAASGVFLGRDAELQQLDAWLAPGARGLVVITGAPGVGKSRLAARFAEREAASLRRSLVCDLGSVTGARGLLGSLAAALGLEGGVGAAPDLARVAADLERSVPGVLVLDDAERLDAEARALLGDLLGRAGGARVVVTSRERLALPLAHTLELEGLAVGAPGAPGDRPAAAELFVARARALGAAPDPADEIAVRAIATALDGNPLAIELASAGASVLSPREILERLERRLDQRGAGDHDGRFPTLRASIRASWDALEDELRVALAMLAVFEGSFSAEAAEAVLDTSVSDPIGALRALRDRSLVAVRRPAGGEAGTGRNRLRLDASVRAFAREQLAGRPDAAAVRARHARFLVERASREADALRRRGLRSARWWLVEEQLELAAIARAGPPAEARAAALALAACWERTGRLAELEELLDEVAARAPFGVEDAVAVAVARAQALGLRGRLREARELLEREVERADRAAAPPPPHLLAEALTHLLVRRRQLGDVDHAIEAGRRAEALLATEDAPHLRAANLACLGLTFAEVGQLASARAADEQARDAFRALGDRWGEGLVLGNLAQLAQGEGHLDEATFFADAAIAAFRDSRDPLYEGVYVGVGASVLRERGDVEGALARTAEAIRLLADRGARHVEGIVRAQHGGLLASVGRTAEARAELDAAQPLVRSAGSPAYLEAVALHRHELELAVGRAAGAGSRAAREASAAAGEALASIADRPPSHRSQFVAFAARMLERELGGRSSAPELRLGPDASWFSAGDRPPVSLARRTAPRLILAALAAAHASARALPVDALFASGWPGERAQLAARTNRVRVAVATLRGLGLEGLLVTRDGGYGLDPRVTVEADARSFAAVGGGTERD